MSIFLWTLWNVDLQMTGFRLMVYGYINKPISMTIEMQVYNWWRRGEGRKGGPALFKNNIFIKFIGF